MIQVKIENKIRIDQIEELFTTCFDELKDGDIEQFDETNNQKFREWFGIDYLADYSKYCDIILAREGKKLIGGAIVGMQNPLSFPDGKKYELFILGVLPKYRNRGIGKMLIQNVIEAAKKNNAQTLILNVHVLMTSTQKFYSDLGFTKMGILDNYYGNGAAVFYSMTL